MKSYKTKSKKYKAMAAEMPQTKHSLRSIRLILTAVVIIAVGVSIAQLFLSNYFATKGEDLSIILAKKETLQEENDRLNSQLATYTSLSYIIQKAQELGLQNANNIVFVSPEKDQPVALQTAIQAIR